MPLANTPASYGTISKSFHWLTVLLILALWPLGWFANWWPYDTQAAFDTKFLLFSLHKTLGVTLFVIALARVVWTLTQPHPRHISENRAEGLAASTVHWLLYGSIIALPITGWIEHAASEGYAPILWPLGQGLPFIPKSVPLSVAFAHMHVALTWVILGAVALHVAGALKHALIDRDGTLARMWFTRRTPPTPPAAKGYGPLPALAAAAVLAAAMAFPFLTAEEPHEESAPAVQSEADGIQSEQSEATEAPTPQTAEAAPPADQTTPADTPLWQVQSGTIALTIQQMGQAVTGAFPDFTAQIAYDPDAPGPEKGQADVTIDIATLSLGSVAAQAQGPDYFDSTQHPTASFSGPIIADDAGNLSVDGTLTIKGHSAPVPLPFTLTIEGDTATASGTTTLDRRSFHVGDTMTDESSLGFTVEITINLTATRAD
ncbi:cytochrome b/b6 domain-containing protein [Oceanicola sp. 502str15]|uniref:cytochrome b/b6 domain-containing protein n=1 Tax=Oceanicola sp. 502str15 TaxID=2696061 RepID=UPI002111E79A|nr:cytochrome b/b6 domain-containing protein [Oceanicola sp. 502str15]MCO6381868.1 cytochrome [Oceanicola sp. 502str15]